MNLLLDTHTFIWWDSQSASLTATVRALYEDSNNILFLSFASIWEMQIKTQLGKLHLRRPLDELVREQCETNDIKMLPIQLAHIYALGQLPMHQRDPFDRLLIAQAKAENLILVSDDHVFIQYGVATVF